MQRLCDRVGLTHRPRTRIFHHESQTKQTNEFPGWHHTRHTYLLFWSRSNAKIPRSALARIIHYLELCGSTGMQRHKSSFCGEFSPLDPDAVRDRPIGRSPAPHNSCLLKTLFRILRETPFFLNRFCISFMIEFVVELCSL